MMMTKRLFKLIFYNSTFSSLQILPVGELQCEEEVRVC